MVDDGTSAVPPRRFGYGLRDAAGQVQRTHPFHGHQVFQPLPPPTGVYPFRLQLADVLPPATMASIEAAGQLMFHMAGDTGGVTNSAPQQIVANHMAAEITSPPSRPGPVPSFFYILGDVIYFYGEAEHYYPQFYEPYAGYPAPIFAIPGNHDGDLPLHPTVPSLAAYIDNFCAASPHVPAEAGAAIRDAMTEPNPYWTLLAPFVTIVGLYTNVPEGGQLDSAQTAWVAAELAAAPKDAALIVAMHHSPYSVDSHHGGSSYIGEVLDQAISESGRVPDLVCAGHVHNYQRFTRTHNGRQVPYVVAGAGGYPNLHPIANSPDGTPPTVPWPVPDSDVTLEGYVADRHGYLRLTASPTGLQLTYLTVPRPQEPWSSPAEVADKVAISI